MYLSMTIYMLLLQVQTEDKFLLGLQRVSSSKANSEGKRGPPVLLLHGLFMVISLPFNIYIV